MNRTNERTNGFSPMPGHLFLFWPGVVTTCGLFDGSPNPLNPLNPQHPLNNNKEFGERKEADKCWALSLRSQEMRKAPRYLTGK